MSRPEERDPFQEPPPIQAPPREVDYTAPAPPAAFGPSFAVPPAEPQPGFLSLVATFLCIVLGLAAAGLFAAGAWFPFIVQTISPAPGGYVLQDPFAGQWVKVSLAALAGATALFTLTRLFFTFSVLSVGGWGVAGFAYWLLFIQTLGKLPAETQAAYKPGLGLMAVGTGGVVLLFAFLIRPRQKRYG